MNTPRPPAAPLLPALAVAICGSVWGLFWIPVRWFESNGIGSGWVMIVFNLAGIVFVLPWMMRRAAWAGFGGQIGQGVLMGTAFSLYAVSLALTDVIHVILLFYLTPVWSTLVGWLYLGERLGPSRVAAMVLGFAGMAVILGVEDGVPLPRNAGDWVALISGMLWAAGTLRSFARPSPGILLPVFCFSVGSLGASAVILAVAGALGMAMAQPGALIGAVPVMAALGICIFLPSNVLVLWAAQRIDSGRVGILLMTEVLVGSITAAWFSGEPYGSAELAGTLLIVCAGLVEVLGRR